MSAPHLQTDGLPIPVSASLPSQDLPHHVNQVVSVGLHIHLFF